MVVGLPSFIDGVIQAERGEVGLEGGLMAEEGPQHVIRILGAAVSQDLPPISLAHCNRTRKSEHANNDPQASFSRQGHADAYSHD